MARYVVMEPPAPIAADGENAVLVRDGFHFLAFIFPPFWLLFNRLWIEAALVFAASMVLAGAGELGGYGSVLAGMSIFLSLYVGLEGANLKLWALRRRGWSEWGAIEADDLDEAETRYLLAAEPWIRPAVASAALPWFSRARAIESGPALGLFDYPGRG